MDEEMKPNTMTDEEETPSGIDGLIARVDEYIQNPKLVTPETLGELKSELLDLKEFIDGEDNVSDGGGDSTNSEDDQEAPGGGLVLMISRAKKGGSK